MESVQESSSLPSDSLSPVNELVRQLGTYGLRAQLLITNQSQVSFGAEAEATVSLLVDGLDGPIEVESISEACDHLRIALVAELEAKAEAKAKEKAKAQKQLEEAIASDLRAKELLGEVKQQLEAGQE